MSANRPQRFNRNGILILDPPREDNKLRPEVCRTPEDHDWGPPVSVRSEYDYAYGAFVVLIEQVCRRCRARDGYWRAE